MTKQDSQEIERVVYPGSFAPIHNGHLDLILRLSRCFSEIWIAIGENREKDHWYSLEERKDLVLSSLKEVGLDSSRVKVVVFSGLLTEFLKENHLQLVCKGVRDDRDCVGEMRQFQLNRLIDENFETLLMPARSEFRDLSSSFCRELASFQSPLLEKFVPKKVYQSLMQKGQSKPS